MGGEAQQTPPTRRDALSRLASTSPPGGDEFWAAVMPTQILMPALSRTMEEGKLAKWLVKEGDEVHSGDILAEIETDKATMEFEAVDEGRIGKILVPEGTENVKVGEVIATMAGEGGEAPAPAPAHEAPA